MSCRRSLFPASKGGIELVWDSGVLIGFPMVDMKVTLFDGAYHEELQHNCLRDRRPQCHARSRG